VLLKVIVVDIQHISGEEPLYRRTIREWRGGRVLDLVVVAHRDCISGVNLAVHGNRQIARNRGSIDLAIHVKGQQRIGWNSGSIARSRARYASISGGRISHGGEGADVWTRQRIAPIVSDSASGNGNGVGGAVVQCTLVEGDGAAVRRKSIGARGL